MRDEVETAFNQQLRSFLARRARIENVLSCYELADDEVRARCAEQADLLKQMLLGNLPPFKD